MPETIDRRDPVLAQDGARLCGRLLCDQKQRPVRQLACVINQLPCGRGVGAALDLDDDLNLAAGAVGSGGEVEAAGVRWTPTETATACSRAQKLALALKGCRKRHRHSMSRRRACESMARGRCASNRAATKKKVRK
jgi:hypothetical protein